MKISETEGSLKDLWLYGGFQKKQESLSRGYGGYIGVDRDYMRESHFLKTCKAYDDG